MMARMNNVKASTAMMNNPSPLILLLSRHATLQFNLREGEF